MNGTNGGEGSRAQGVDKWPWELWNADDLRRPRRSRSDDHPSLKWGTEVEPERGQSWLKSKGWRAGVKRTARKSTAEAWRCLTQVEPTVRGSPAKPNGRWSKLELREEGAQAQEPRRRVEVEHSEAGG